MGFSPDVVALIWENAGGRLKAVCVTCGKSYNEGYCLDASHLDHTRDEDYNKVERGVLECLYCHLNRHLEELFFVALSGDVKAIRRVRLPCEQLIIRILNGEARHPYPKTSRELEDIQRIKLVLGEFIIGFIETASREALALNENPLCVQNAGYWLNELFYMFAL